MKNQKVRMSIIELNEFCPDFLLENSKNLNLKILKKYLLLNIPQLSLMKKRISRFRSLGSVGKYS